MLNIFFPFVGLGDLNRKEQKIMAWYQKYSHVSLPVLKALTFKVDDGHVFVSVMRKKHDRSNPNTHSCKGLSQGSGS